MNIKNIFEKYNLILPDYNNLNIIDLMKCIFNRHGLNFPKTKNIETLEKLIPDNKNTLFIIIDGMGSNLISNLKDNSILKKNKKTDLLTVSPSTTGCVLTSVATASFPIEHGIIGWYSHNKKLNIDYCPVLFKERKNLKSLEEQNITPEDIFKKESLFNKLTTKTKVLYPKDICNSTYSNFTASTEKRIPYENYEDIVNIIKDICQEKDNTFTHLYISKIDSLEHDNGTVSDLVYEELKEIEKMITKLSTIKDLTIIITADHGQIDIKEDNTMDFNKYSKYFYGMPGIDFGTTSFYVKEEEKENFEKEFSKDYQDKMYLFNTEEFLKVNIFGQNEICENFQNNIGEYIGVCKKYYNFINLENIEDYQGKIIGNHSGFSKEEMIIPLIIINSNQKTKE